MVCIDADQPVPGDLGAVSGLVFMGGAMSVNDGFDWIADELTLIRRALSEGIPILGICFGGQLLCKALGGEVWRGAGMEIGWHPVQRIGESGADWLDGVASEFEAFHWHAETFAIPAGSEHLLRSQCYPNQAFAWGDHLAMQFHLEMTEDMVLGWIERYGSDLDLDSRCIQERRAVIADLGSKVRCLNQIADRVYGGWLQRVQARRTN